MVKKKRQALFLGADRAEEVPSYKRLYGSIEEEVFTGNITITREEEAVENDRAAKSEEQILDNPVKNEESFSKRVSTFLKGIKNRLK